MNGIAKDREFIRLTAVSLSAPVIWSAHFGMSYGLQHFICRTGRLPETLVTPTILVATLVAVLLMAIIMWRTAKGPWTDLPADATVARFYKYATLFMLVLSLFGVIATCLSGLMLPACAELR